MPLDDAPADSVLSPLEKTRENQRRHAKPIDDLKHPKDVFVRDHVGGSGAIRRPFNPVDQWRVDTWNCEFENGEPDPQHVKATADPPPSASTLKGFPLFHDPPVSGWPHSLHGPPEAAAVPGAILYPHAGQRSRYIRMNRRIFPGAIHSSQSIAA
jgi:hypothetical protein